MLYFVEIIPMQGMTSKWNETTTRLLQLATTPPCPPLCNYTATSLSYSQMYSTGWLSSWALVANTYDATIFLVDMSRDALAAGINLANGTEYLAAISNNKFTSLS